MEPNKKKKTWLTIPIAILCAGVMVSGSVLYVGKVDSASIGNALQGDIAANDAPVAVKDPSSLFGPTDPQLGTSDAKVTIVEFSDFQCPFCRVFFNDTYAELKKTYIDTGKARLIFRDFPLSFHDAAKPAAMAAQCAQDQGKFWEYHDKIFVEQQKKGQNTISFGVVDLKAWAAQLGLNTGQFNSCLDSSKHEAGVQADMKAGADAGVSGTPTFFINGQILVGAQPFSAFKDLIDKELAK